VDGYRGENVRRRLGAAADRSMRGWGGKGKVKHSMRKDMTNCCIKYARRLNEPIVVRAMKDDADADHGWSLMITRMRMQMRMIISMLMLLMTMLL